MASGRPADAISPTNPAADVVKADPADAPGIPFRET
jgi:hypothetical protein